MEMKNKGSLELNVFVLVDSADTTISHFVRICVKSYSSPRGQISSFPSPPRIQINACMAPLMSSDQMCSPLSNSGYLTLL